MKFRDIFKYSFTTLCLASSHIKAFSQNLPFENFSVERGLSQSQVFAITQDAQKHLWIGTYGGLNRFDGSSFKLFTKKDGLNSNVITALYNSHQGGIWVGTRKGLSYYDGRKFINYTIQGRLSDYDFFSLAEDDQATIYALDRKGNFFRVKNKILEKVLVAEDSRSPVTCLYKDRGGQLWVYVYGKGFYTYKKDEWQQQNAFDLHSSNETIRYMCESNGSCYAISNKKNVYKIYQDRVAYVSNIQSEYIFSVEVASNGDIWMGTGQGLKIFDGINFTLKKEITSSNGIGENFIIDIFKDTDDNIWLGSDGQGLFRYSYGEFLQFNQSHGLFGNIVMGITEDKSGNLLIGTREGGLQKFNSSENNFSKIDYSSLSRFGINCMGTDSNKNLYISTMDSRCLIKKGAAFQEISLLKKYRPGIFSFTPYKTGVIANTTIGAFIVDGHKVEQVADLRLMVTSSLVWGKDVIFGTSKGVYIMGADKKIKTTGIPMLSALEVNTLTKYKNYVIIGSNDGVFFWNTDTQSLHVCNIEDGLSDNNIFAVLCDAKGKIWVGTTSGLHQIFLKPNGDFEVKRFARSDGYESSETNLNAIYEDANGHIWVGTTKGVFVYSRQAGNNKMYRPHVVIQSVEMSSVRHDSLSKKEFTLWNHLPSEPKITYANNSISFKVKAVYLKDPHLVKYAYRLAGYETAFTKPATQSFLSYKNLEPGKYILQVKAYIPNGIVSENIAEYPFTIITPFYKSIWFRMLAVSMLIMLGITINYVFVKIKVSERKESEALRAKEQERLREQTAEDFHDELGNKLTRITILTDVLQSKMDPEDLANNHLVSQIKANALALYTGTKEIVWSLSKENANLLEVVQTLRKIGNELFNDTSIEFRILGIEHVDESIQLPAGYNRNIIMIFKELFNNSLRHSGCDAITIEIRPIIDRVIIFHYSDNGKGFDEANVTKGNGLSNIERRVQRINGIFSLRSIQNNGTACLLKIHL